MSPESSPFSPGQPVPIEFFVGRVQEIEQLRSLVRSATKARFKIGFVTGERGIGKTSLVSFVRHLSEREDQIAGAHVFLGGTKSVPEMIRRTLDKLLKESIEKPWYGKIKDFFGKHVGEVGLFGISVELKLDQEDLKHLMHEFVPTVRQLLAKLKSERKAFLLILDDINGLANTQEFANWLKSTVDEIATSTEGLNLCMLIVGLEERRQELLAIQPSLDRVFSLTEIRPWDEAETSDFFTKTFRNGSATVADDALQWMVHYTGGLPVIGHEIGDAVWRVAETTAITDSDTRVGIHQAAQIIGSKFLQPKVIAALHSTRHRSILRRLASNPFGFHFRRADLIKLLGPDDKRVLDNFLNRLKELGVIVSDAEAGAGAYHFTNRLHYLYFQIESRKAGAEPRRRKGSSYLP